MRTENFDNFGPDAMIDAVETALGKPMSGLAAPLPSYINRVYELQTVAKERIIAKFYRPGRWNREAIEEEHSFVLDCAADEIPVIAPMIQADGNTLGETGDGIFFVLYPKRFGREIEIIDDDGWRRLGTHPDSGWNRLSHYHQHELCDLRQWQRGGVIGALLAHQFGHRL